ncbi:hypothetical protein CVT24_009448 [Panaeolus cyanescens]|uniref:Uncharacterized protein n=1 Tax=Panaeolus cyanescens TaxID=181874 RepID=A0A409W3H2_9AGAR|nr:hypothetical protein CVT24_009448 [Panaeolus cyanescens]
MHTAQQPPSPSPPVPAPPTMPVDKDVVDNSLDPPGTVSGTASSTEVQNEVQDFVHQVGAERVYYHPMINGLPCDAEGRFLPPDSPPLPTQLPSAPDDYSPFDSRASFELADLLYRENQMSASQINKLMEIFAATMDTNDPPFFGKDDLYATIDSIQHGDAPWKSFSLSYSGEIAPNDTTPWKTKEFDVWYRDPHTVLQHQLANPDFSGEMDFAPKVVMDDYGTRRYCDMMSGQWAWRQADILAENPNNHGSTFCPIILGSDKTTVSVATGQNDYYPLYMSNGLVHNNVRRAHRNAVTLIAFLAIPKTSKDHEDSDEFRKFRREVFHRSLATILQSLKPGMEKPELMKYCDGFYRWTIFGIGPYIADYPEQVLLACIVQNWCPLCTAQWNKLDDSEAGRRSHKLTEALMDVMGPKALWSDFGIIDGILPFTHEFPRADIHELLSPDLLHQIIKGTFKDHLVTWVTQYIEKVNSPEDAKKIIADIDRRIATTPLFPGLRQFHQGRGFKQWTGDDSKGLMKVYLPAISGHIPSNMVRAVSSFMEFCYLVRRSVLDEDDLRKINAAVSDFHKYRTAFDTVRPEGYSLPRQHSLVHYVRLIQDFGAPNGLCSSITESKHIKAVKEPWRRSSRFEAMSQMLLTNQRLDKLAAARVDFAARGMLDGDMLGYSLNSESVELQPPSEPALLASNAENVVILDDDVDEEDVDGDVMSETILAQRPIRKIPRDVIALGHFLGIPKLHEYLSRFLYSQTNPDDRRPVDEVPLDDCPTVRGKVYVYSSAVSTYYAPSDLSGMRGMHREHIRAVSKWRNGPGRYDTVYVSADPLTEGFQGLLVARVRLFLSVTHKQKSYPCALVSWFSTVGEDPCPDTGMWIVEPDLDENGERIMSVIHLDSILRGAHLIGCAGKGFLPVDFESHHSLDAFPLFYVNKYVDHHAHEIAF